MSVSVPDYEVYLVDYETLHDSNTPVRLRIYNGDNGVGSYYYVEQFGGKTSDVDNIPLFSPNSVFAAASGEIVIDKSFVTGLSHQIRAARLDRIDDFVVTGSRINNDDITEIELFIETGTFDGSINNFTVYGGMVGGN